MFWLPTFYHFLRFPLERVFNFHIYLFVDINWHSIFVFSNIFSILCVFEVLLVLLGNQVLLFLSKWSCSFRPRLLFIKILLLQDLHVLFLPYQSFLSEFSFPGLHGQWGVRFFNATVVEKVARCISILNVFGCAQKEWALGRLLRHNLTEGSANVVVQLNSGA